MSKKKVAVAVAVPVLIFCDHRCDLCICCPFYGCENINCHCENATKYIILDYHIHDNKKNTYFLKISINNVVFEFIVIDDYIKKSITPLDEKTFEEYDAIECDCCTIDCLCGIKETPRRIKFYSSYQNGRGEVIYEKDVYSIVRFCKNHYIFEKK